jgi:hypothetical protein
MEVPAGGEETFEKPRTYIEGINPEHLYQEFILSGVLVGLGKTPQEAIEQVEQWERDGTSQLLASPWQLSNCELKSLPAVKPKCTAPLHFELVLTSYTIPLTAT